MEKFRKMIVIIPMAGESSRFKERGILIPKYMLYAGYHSMFYHSLSSFRDYFGKCFFVFVCRDVFDTPRFVQGECAKLGIENYDIKVLNNSTRGQAETVKFGLTEHYSHLESELIIFNIDTYRKGLILPTYNDDTIAFFEVFRGAGSNWSFAEIREPSDIIIRTTEKEPISDLCSTGLYFFKSASLFLEAYECYYSKDFSSEFYVAPLYNSLIKKGTARILLINSTDVFFYGVPNEYLDFVKWELSEGG
jgi:dTDP-glucose pyrophosphorylase